MEYSLFKIENFPSPNGLTALIFVPEGFFFFLYYIHIYTFKNNFIRQAHIKFITEKNALHKQEKCIVFTFY